MYMLFQKIREESSKMGHTQSKNHLPRSLKLQVLSKERINYNHHLDHAHYSDYT